MKIQVFLALTLLWISGPVSAIPSYVYSGGQVTGVTGLEVDGVLWDMTLHDASYDELYAALGDSALYTMAFSEAVTDALVTFTNTQADLASTIIGCGVETSCAITTVFEYTGTQYAGYYDLVRDNEVDFSTWTWIPSDANHSGITYATWTVANVPEPSVVLLMASGLMVFGIARRKDRT